MTGENRSIISAPRNRQKRWSGHVIRHDC